MAKKKTFEYTTPDSPSFWEQAVCTRQYKYFPEILRGPEGVRKVLSLCEKEPEYGIGIDFEFDPKTNKPSILGVSYCGNNHEHLCAAAIFDLQLLRNIYDSGLALIAYAGTTADRLVTDESFGFETDLARWADPMIRHYLLNPDYCAAPQKEEDEDDASTLGLMNLWSSASQYTMLPNWKFHYEGCHDRPCPKCDVFAYCAVDAYAGHVIWHETQHDLVRFRIPEKLYTDLVDLSVYCDLMSKKGIRVDRELIRQLEREFEARKYSLFPNEPHKKSRRFGTWSDPDEWGEILWTPGDFNPNSPKKIVEYFHSLGIELKGKRGKASTSKDDVVKALNRCLRKEFRDVQLEFDTQALAVVDLEGNDWTERLPSSLKSLTDLALYKYAGKGLKSWFDDSYIDENDEIHPRFIVTGTGPGRLSSADPNFQNIPRVGFGARVRRVLLPHSSTLKWVKADVSGLEYRVIFWYAGQKKAPDKIFEDIVAFSQGKLEHAASARSVSPRDVAKSLVHAGNYMEGLRVVTESDLRTSRIQKEIAEGALKVYRDWYYRGGYVAFTGGNLAERLFGKRGNKERKLALELQDCYFDKYPFIRELQRKVSQQIEHTRRVRAANGHTMELYGTPEDDLKLALAFLGQGSGAAYVREGMLRFHARGDVANLQVHDELGFEVPREWPDAKCVDFMSTMSEESTYFPGLRCPIKCYSGERYKEGNEEDELHVIGKTTV